MKTTLSIRSVMLAAAVACAAGAGFAAGDATPAPDAPAPTREASAVWLSLRSPQRLVPGVPATVAWNVIDKQSLLIRPDAAAPGRVGCSQDGTQVRLHVELTIAAPPDVAVRALFLVNGATYLPAEADAVDGRLVLDAVAELDAGDVVEAVVVAEAAGDEATGATIEPQGSFLAVAPE